MHNCVSAQSFRRYSGVWPESERTGFRHAACQLFFHGSTNVRTQSSLRFTCEAWRGDGPGNCQTMVGTQTKRMWARHLPTIFRRSTDVRTNCRIVPTGRVPACRGGEGGAAGQPPVGQPRFFERLSRLDSLREGLSRRRGGCVRRPAGGTSLRQPALFLGGPNTPTDVTRDFEDGPTSMVGRVAVRARNSYPNHRRSLSRKQRRHYPECERRASSNPSIQGHRGRESEFRNSGELSSRHARHSRVFPTERTCGTHLCAAGRAALSACGNNAYGYFRRVEKP